MHTHAHNTHNQVIALARKNGLANLSSGDQQSDQMIMIR